MIRHFRLLPHPSDMDRDRKTLSLEEPLAYFTVKTSSTFRALTHCLDTYQLCYPK